MPRFSSGNPVSRSTARMIAFKGLEDAASAASFSGIGSLVNVRGERFLLHPNHEFRFFGQGLNFEVTGPHA